ncbi:hypothetical protein AYX14_07012 [Cryptococcus neoformans]|nr:hypothetical protein AYX15_07027 [Cryptococcus neoformans var. grubii]OWZ61306.1 hypothetical protein AYX14_07012 [Cryptococcus neoformans var. grubii]
MRNHHAAYHRLTAASASDTPENAQVINPKNSAILDDVEASIRGSVMGLP